MELFLQVVNLLFSAMALITGLALLLMEFARSGGDDDSDALDTFRLSNTVGFLIFFIRKCPWYVLGGYLILGALARYYFDEQPPNSFGLGGVFSITFALAMAFARIYYLKRIELAINKHPFLIRTGPHIVRDEKGVMIRDVTPTTPGLVRLTNPAFNNAVVECIADEKILAGKVVRVVEQECDFLKVTKA
jgi:hypothetical protein